MLMGPGTIGLAATQVNVFVNTVLATRQGTGIVFNDYDPQGVRWALHAALDLFADRDAWLQMMRILAFPNQWLSRS